MRFKLKIGNKSPIWWPIDKETRNFFVSEFVEKLTGTSRNKAYLDGIEISSEHKIKHLIRDGDTIEIRLEGSPNQGKSRTKTRNSRRKKSRSMNREDGGQEEKTNDDGAYHQEHYDEECCHEKSGIDRNISKGMNQNLNIIASENVQRETDQIDKVETPVLSAGQSRYKNINLNAIECQYPEYKVFVPPYPFQRNPIKRYGQVGEEDDSMIFTHHNGKSSPAQESPGRISIFESTDQITIVPSADSKTDIDVENPDSPPKEEPIKMIRHTNSYKAIRSGSVEVGIPSQSTPETTLIPTSSIPNTGPFSPSLSDIRISSKELFEKLSPDSGFLFLSSLKPHQVFVVSELVCEPPHYLPTLKYRTIKFHGPISNGYLIQTAKSDMSKPKSKGKFEIDNEEEDNVIEFFSEEDKRVKKLELFGYEKFDSDLIGQSRRLAGEDNEGSGIKVNIAGIACPTDYFIFNK